MVPEQAEKQPSQPFTAVVSQKGSGDAACVFACGGTGDTGQWTVSCRFLGHLKWMQQEGNALSAVSTNPNVTCCGDPSFLSPSSFFLNHPSSLLFHAGSSGL